MLGAPRGTRQLVAEDGSADIERIGPVQAEEQLDLQPALFAIGREVESKLTTRRLTANARSVVIVRDGRYRNAAGHFEIAVLDHRERLIGELSPDAIGPHLHRVYGQLSWRRERRLSGRVVVLTTPGARANYFHWCLELLPKIHLLRKAGLFDVRRDLFLVNHGGAAYQSRTLELLAIPASRIIAGHPGIKVSAEQLVVPSHATHHEAVPASAIAFVRSAFLPERPARAGGKKIYLHRGGAKRRRITNGAEIGALLEKRGFTTVDAARLTFDEQVAAFAGATTIVAPHGAGLTNLAFSSPGARVLEIFSPYYAPDYFRLVAQHAKLRYGCVAGAPVGRRARVPERQRIEEPFRVPLDRIDAAVDQLENLR